MASIWDVIAGVGDFLVKGGSAIYDRYYQAKTQQEQYEREDNAVERRVQDLENSGLNPALAHGSSAGAGTVVSRNNSEFGSALDTMNAIKQIESQKQQIEYEKTQNELAKIDKENAYLQAQALRMQLYSSLGFNVYPHLFNGDLSYTVSGKAACNGMFTYPEASPLFQIERNLYIQNQLNSAAMLQFDRDFYSRHQIFKNFVQPITGAVLQGGATAARMYGAFGPK